MHPKPPPPTSLLLPRQKWILVPSVNWKIAEGNKYCYYTVAERRPCGEEAAVQWKDFVAFSREGLCIDHMGSFQWINDQGVLVQWRADPPFLNKKPIRYGRWRSGRSQQGTSG